MERDLRNVISISLILNGPFAKFMIHFLMKPMFTRIKSTAKMQEYILITDVSLNTYRIFRAKKTLNIILSY